MVRKYVSLLPNEGVKYIKLLVVIVNLLEITSQCITFLHTYHIVSSCGPGGQFLTVSRSGRKYQNVKFNFIFWREIGKD